MQELAKHEANDNANELQDLAADADVPLEVLLARYGHLGGGGSDSDSDMPEASAEPEGQPAGPTAGPPAGPSTATTSGEPAQTAAETAAVEEETNVDALELPEEALEAGGEPSC